VHLDETWRSVGKLDPMGLIGFCLDSEQSADMKTLKLWFSLLRYYRDVPVRHVISKLFHGLVWEDDEMATITVNLAKPLKNPDGLLKRFAEQIEDAIYRLEEEEARAQVEHWLEDEPEDPLVVYSASGELGGIEIS